MLAPAVNSRDPHGRQQSGSQLCLYPAEFRRASASYSPRHRLHAGHVAGASTARSEARRCVRALRWRLHGGACHRRNSDFWGAVQFCAAHPEAWECRQMRQVRHGGPAPTEVTSLASAHDPRIRAAVIAAPAAIYNFSSGGLAQVTIPLQLWSAEDDKITPRNGILRFFAQPCPLHPSFAPSRGPIISPSSRLAARRWPTWRPCSATTRRALIVSPSIETSIAPWSPSSQRNSLGNLHFLDCRAGAAEALYRSLADPAHVDPQQAAVGDVRRG
jgi:hypothetical protein